ncbi:MAG: cupin domain-containing protein [Deltaproteobacteria bacterium]|nr:cupin domain-containing protein [Deltaproteobacteria bacterium]
MHASTGRWLVVPVDGNRLGGAVTGFDRVNLGDARLAHVQAHGGVGLIGFCRLADAASLAGACNFIDLAVLPPGGSIGLHRHSAAQEEFYLVLDGTGTMHRNGEPFAVRAGDLVRNPPAAEHGLVNSGSTPLRIFVFEVRVP